MECQDLRQLLAFLERKSEELDAEEHAALQKHLDACPDCAALAAQDRSADQAIGLALRNVAVPAGLKQHVLQRLAAERGTPWKRWAFAAAAAVVLATAGVVGIVWTSVPKPDFIIGLQDNRTWNQDEVEHYLAEQGFPAKAAGNLKYDLLRQVDVILIKGRSVAKLTFDDGVNSATVYIVDTRRHTFNFNGDPSIRPLPTEDGSQFKYILHCRGDAHWLMQPVF
jgi:hypothetical protein